MGNTRAGCVATRVLEVTAILLDHPVGKYCAFLRRIRCRILSALASPETRDTPPRL